MPCIFCIAVFMIVGSAIAGAVADHVEQRLARRAKGAVRRVSESASVAKLEADILDYGGCREALVVWQGHHILLDGHNRLRLCQRHGLTNFRLMEQELPDRQAAKQ